MDTAFLQTASATEIAAMVRAGRMTAESIIVHFLERIKTYEPSIHAFAFHDPDDALAQARAIDRNPIKGALAGVPLGVKDIYDTAQVPTEFFSPIYAGNVPARDAAVVAQLREHGAVMIGKTATTEFAFMHTGPTRNPHDLGHTPGSSSAGSGAGMAAGFFPLALGTQTAGSLLKPASFCGAFAYKPSFGLVSVEGVKPLAPSFDTVGWFGRCIEDLALVAQVLIPAIPSFSATERLRLAVFRGPRSVPVDPALQHCLDIICVRLREGGHVVDELDPPAGLEEAYEYHRQINDVEGARSLNHERTRFPDLLSDEIHSMMSHADEICWASELDAKQKMQELRKTTEAAIASYDGVLDLSTQRQALQGLASTGPSDLIKVWSGLGFPQVNVPAATEVGTLPFGLQLFAARFQDARLLSAAATLAAFIGAPRLRPAF